MTTHTPGPWRTNGHLIEGPKMALQVAIAYAPKLGNAPRTAEEAKANARLIAAAPDLLAALEILLVQKPYRDGDGAAMYHAENIARIAIAKAKGIAS